MNRSRNWKLRWLVVTFVIAISPLVVSWAQVLQTTGTCGGVPLSSPGAPPPSACATAAVSCEPPPGSGTCPALCEDQVWGDQPCVHDSEQYCEQWQQCNFPKKLCRVCNCNAQTSTCINAGGVRQVDLSVCVTMCQN